MSTYEELADVIRTGRLDPEQQAQLEAVVLAASAVVKGADNDAAFYEGFTPVEEFALDELTYALESNLETYQAIRDRFAGADWSLDADGENDTGVYAEQYVAPWKHDQHDSPEVNCPLCPLPSA